MPRTELTAIVDRVGRAALAKEMSHGCTVIDARDVDALSMVRRGALLIDVDLRDIDQVRLIKDNLPKADDDRIRIVAVERGSHRCEIQARGLGASDLLKRPWSFADLSRCLQRHANRHTEAISLEAEEIQREPGGSSILSAAIELDRLFTALTANGALDLASVEQAGDQVVGAVAEVGLAKWLDSVRRYHKSTFQHCLLVTGVLTTFGHKTGMRKQDVLTLTVGGLLHDIGKAQVSTDILDKPGKLTDEEFAEIKKHPLIGYDYLRKQNLIAAETLAAVRHHHEYLDGSGYPDGLTGQQIGDLTRIMTICDIYGALVERRSYKEPKSPAAAIEILTRMARDGKVEYELVKALERSVAA
ncbi:MAG: HD domain-containing protein [Bradyrhizobiaceae bacterium]|nr:HD domain-containing protein [Hyphomicrobiales bacterium]MBV9430079.1 HD domain-containing protein [Bradyrhizobiaceae bacterium]